MEPRLLAHVALALLLGAIVTWFTTLRQHRSGNPFWNARLARTRLRRADMPLGGGLIVGVALLGYEGELRAALLAFGVGAALGALAGGLADPLPGPRPSSAEPRTGESPDDGPQ